ncbi:MAG: metallophosphoesterase family protein [Bacteroidota bacterium]|nr:metallophosphoesterase family protein [Bacteroidota bacterium]
MRIGLISDSHGFIHPGVFDFFEDVDEVWHAGDIGNIALSDQLEKFKPLRAVYGNIDGQDVRLVYPKDQIFTVAGAKIFITHIGGYPKRYDSRALKIINKEKPDLFISGHSHILKIINDQEKNMLHINPGAVGKSGFHYKVTAVKFEIYNGRFKNLSVFEVDR